MKYLVLFFAVLFSVSAFSQDLLNSRKTSYYTYIYKITNDEAKMIAEKGSYNISESFFHTLVDSVLTDNFQIPDLFEGHYLKVYSVAENIYTQAFTIQNFYVDIANNDADIIIKVFDNLANTILDAEVELNGVKVKFDEESKSYRIKKSNRKGLLTVEYNENVYFYNLNRSRYNPYIYRFGKTIYYSEPMRLVRNTFYYSKNLILHPYRTTRYIIWDINSFFSNLFTYNPNDYKGYLVFNKPKFKPGDTVMLKAFIVNEKGKPYKKDLDLVLYNSQTGKRINLAELEPYRKGAYKYEFVLNDSLDLTLDTWNYIYLEKRENKSVMTGNFYFEEYELKESKFEMRSIETEQFDDKQFAVFLKATDENDLNLLDAKVDLYCKTSYTTETFADLVFIPDTFLTTNIELDALGETKIVIPDSLMPKANFTYSIFARMTTSDNEIIDNSLYINYFADKHEIDYRFSNDSIEFFYKFNDKEVEKDFSTTTYDVNSKVISNEQVTLPYKTKINYTIKYYTFFSPEFTGNVMINSAPTSFNTYAFRKNDSVYVTVTNPRKVPFNYFIYKGDKEIARGCGTELDYKNKANEKKMYTVEIEYLWAGDYVEISEEIPLYNKLLNIDVQQPDLIYPGQDVDIEITVTDAQGSPVEDVDLTAFSMTKKFSYTPPSLPYFGTSQKSREELNNFNLYNTQLTNASRSLAIDYKNWNLEFGLDSIEYYKFLYPDSGFYHTDFKSENGKTQFAPFIIKDGKIQPIFAIYLDNVPVYISMTTTSIPFSFEILNPKYAHSVQIRTYDKLITLGNFFFKENTKTIFSIDLDYNSITATRYVRKNAFFITVTDMPNTLSQYEINNLQNYLFAYRANFGTDISWLEQNGKYFELTNNGYYSITGPVIQQNMYLKNYINESENTNFVYEPLFEYEFDFPKIKMRTKVYPTTFIPKTNTSFSDEILTKADIDEKYKNLVLTYRKYGSYIDAYYTYGTYYLNQGWNNNLQINLTGVSTPLNIIIYDKVTHNVCLTAGSVRNFYYLSSNEHKVIFLYEDGKYFVKDSVILQPYGKNYLKVTQPDVLLKDTFGIFCDDLLNTNCFAKNSGLQQTISDFLKSTIEYTEIKGNVFTKEGIAIEGVKVAGSKLQNSVITDKNGSFIIKIMKDESLTFSKSGFDNFTLSSFISDCVEIYLTKANILFTDNSQINNVYNLIGTISGYVLDEYGEVIPGASVVAKGTTVGTVTDIDGNYTLSNIPYDATTLVFSFIGFENLEVAINGQSVINATLYTGDNIIDEVVVTAMGITREEKKLAYSVCKVESDVLYVAKEKDILESLNGIVTGDDISGGLDFGNKANDINPEDIESIDYLQDGRAKVTLKNGEVFTVYLDENSDLSQIEIKGASYDMDFFNAAMSASGIRSNFSDYAFWQPALFTDENGKAKFTITFPDDVTQWRTFVLAMNSKKQTGQTEGAIKSYKPLMAQLALPNFAVSGDKLGVIGKSLNYTPDIYNITTNFEVNDSSVWQRQYECENAVIDTLVFIADESDTMKIKYFMETTDGYIDGEERDLPIYPVGVQLAKGQFYSFDNDTTFKLDLTEYDGDIEFTAMADAFDVILYETANVINYEYLCNEQLASKLFALLTEKTIKEFKGVKFKKDDDINEIITKLEKNQNDDKLWSWWNRGKTSEWISFHVIKALLKAKEAGYTVNVDFEAMKNVLIWKLESDRNTWNTPYYVHLLRDWSVENFDYRRYIDKYDSIFTDYYTDRNLKVPPEYVFNLVEMKQICNIEVNVDTIFDYMYSTMYGNKYFSTNWDYYYIYNNRTTLTLSGYKILKRAGGYDDILQKIRSYFFEKDGGCYWRNTYETALIIETILPEYINGEKKITKPELTFSGAINETVTEFPYTATIKSGDSLIMEKDGIFPTYLSVYQRYWETEPSENTEYFDVETEFYDVKMKTIRPYRRYWYYYRNIRQYIPVDTLDAGNPLILRTTVKVKKDAEYVQIEIPIPAGCSYTAKPNNFAYEEHREYFENKTSIFCEKLTKGTYIFEVELTPRYTGTYTLNPAKAELMYFPIFYGNNEIKTVEIGE